MSPWLISLKLTDDIYFRLGSSIIIKSASKPVEAEVSDMGPTKNQKIPFNNNTLIITICRLQKNFDQYIRACV